jgi:adenosylcobinamide-GDP ribazoletransferase
MFSVLPSRPLRAEGAEAGPLDRARTGRALCWLPLVGGLLGGLAGLVAVAVLKRDGGATLLAGALGVVLLAALSGGLHLDGLADTADGLASRTPREQALEIMRRSDIGPFGTLALVTAVGLDAAALATIGASGHPWRVLAALATAAVTGRLAATLAGSARVPAARPSGFGALVAGSVPRTAALALSAATLAGGGLLAGATDASIAGWLITQAVALALAEALRRAVSRHLGGVTGDVFGALIEVTTTLVLLGLALSR